MTNTTASYWDVDGESLQTYAKNIVTIGSGRDGVPSLRGSNRRVPYRPGTLHLPKYPDERVLTLGMWVRGVDDDDIGGSQATEALFWENLRALKRLLWREDGAQFDLTKRWVETGGSKIATAAAEYAGGLDIDALGGWAGKFTVDLLLADPYFYGEEITEDVEVSDTPIVMNNPGDVRADWFGVSVVFSGPLTNPTLTNGSSTPDLILEYADVLAVDETVTVDVENALAINQLGENVINKIVHTGGRSFFGLLRGDNSLVLTADDGDGIATVTFHPPYF